MAKAPGQNAHWKAAKDFNNTFPTFLTWITEQHPKALQVLASYLDNDSNSNLQFGAAKSINEMALKFYKEFKNVTPKDFEHLSITKPVKGSATGKQEEGNGLIKLTYDGTNG